MSNLIEILEHCVYSSELEKAMSSLVDIYIKNMLMQSNTGKNCMGKYKTDIIYTESIYKVTHAATGWAKIFSEIKYIVTRVDGDLDKSTKKIYERALLKSKQKQINTIAWILNIKWGHMLFMMQTTKSQFKVSLRSDRSCKMWRSILVLSSGNTETQERISPAPGLIRTEGLAGKQHGHLRTKVGFAVHGLNRDLQSAELTSLNNSIRVEKIVVTKIEFPCIEFSRVQLRN